MSRFKESNLQVNGQPASKIDPDFPSEYQYRHRSSKVTSPLSMTNSRFTDLSKLQGLNNNSALKINSDPFEAAAISPSHK